jgi:hypothetical protein
MKTGDSLPCDEIPYGVTSVHFSNRPISDDPIKSLAIIIRLSRNRTPVLCQFVCVHDQQVYILKRSIYSRYQK